MRKLKYHEKKLLKKVDFLDYPKERTKRELSIISKYHIGKRDHYVKYRKLIAQIQDVLERLEEIPNKDRFRIGLTEQLTGKLKDLGIITKRNVKAVKEMGVSNICERRLAIVMVRLNFVTSFKDATTYIEAGHVRIGTELITDPSYIVSTQQEDLIAWLDSSKIKQHIDNYTNTRDDYDG